MNEIYSRAKELQNYLVKIRREIHQNPEVGQELPQTIAVVKRELKAMGCTPIEKGGGIWADIGSGSPVFLMRADMDALPMPEENNLPYKSQNACAAHTCGHDIHTAMLLGAAKILKEYETQLCGTVRVMFQADEEGGTGCRAMVAAGVLENPKVDVAIAMHTAAQQPTGNIFFTQGSSMASSDLFEIQVYGKGGHGAGPQFSIDPINIACHIHLSLQELIAREAPPAEMTVLTIGCLQAGDAPNIIPETAVLKGTLRTHNQQTREKLLKRIQEVCTYTAKAFSGQAELSIKSSIPVLYSNPELVSWLMNNLNTSIPEIHTTLLDYKAGGSEDFAEICNCVPSAYLSIGTGLEKDGFLSGQHNPKVIFDEQCMANGTAVFAQSALNWLKEHKK